MHTYRLPTRPGPFKESRYRNTRGLVVVVLGDMEIVVVLGDMYTYVISYK